MSSDFDELRLELLELSAREVVARQLFDGAHRPDITVAADVVRDLVFTLNAYVLSEDAGGEVTEQIRATLPVRPRWLPRWAWRRIPTRRVCWSVTAQPLWTYPQATLRVPGLGPAHLIARSRTDYRLDDPPDGGSSTPAA